MIGRAHLLVLSLTLSLTAEPLWAYVDPGSGTVLLQLFLAGVAGLLVAVRFYWRRVGRFLKNWWSPRSSTGEDGAPNP